MADTVRRREGARRERVSGGRRTRAADLPRVADDALALSGAKVDVDVDVDRVRGSRGAAPAGQLRAPVDQAVSLVMRLLDQAPKIRVRATSQAPLVGTRNGWKMELLPLKDAKVPFSSGSRPEPAAGDEVARQVARHASPSITAGASI